MQGFNTGKRYGTAAEEINHRQASGYSEISKQSYQGSCISCTGGVSFPNYKPPSFARRNYFSRAKENTFNGVFNVLLLT